ncbi:hypothetical protein L596_027342 [Steinernema carpocapsae]|uniref:Uncharacterized protein n=1 Tax=Steinernema carpocapsae TaxID=34508 RepID=A0A4U5M413_STECR|nr:hypothetical protein L596_027342 [Steinernema carpocapsae]
MANISCALSSSKLPNCSDICFSVPASVRQETAQLDSILAWQKEGRRTHRWFRSICDSASSTLSLFCLHQ